MYRTEHAATQITQPRGYPKTARDINARVFAQKGGKGLVYLHAVMDVIQDPAHWKNGFYVIFPEIDKEWVKAAIIWFHGCEPKESAVGIYSTGYAC